MGGNHTVSDTIKGPIAPAMKQQVRLTSRVGAAAAHEHIQPAVTVVVSPTGPAILPEIAAERAGLHGGEPAIPLVDIQAQRR